ncbi:MAG: zinc ribbon domain-containing protein [bacterium]|nr:zinc ribbon domain-containing protein [bacterium]MDI1337300.1 zinc ribbon domain-containing protein [Lacunisphaera sp.]
MAHAFSPPDVCPVCGESVPRNARACPGCGADERSGWNEDATRYDGLDLPDSAFSEETEQAARRQHTRGLWLVVGAGLLVLGFLGLILR